MAGKKESSWENQFEKKIKELEERIDELGDTLEKKAENFGRIIEKRGKDFSEKMESEAEQLKSRIVKKGRGSHNVFWGIVLVVMGILWLGKNLDWFYYDIPWVPIALIAGGIFLIVRNWEGRDPSSAGKSGEQHK